MQASSRIECAIVELGVGWAVFMIKNRSIRLLSSKMRCGVVVFDSTVWSRWLSKLGVFVLVSERAKSRQNQTVYVAYCSYGHRAA
jgi:hypothetical protein